MIYDANKGTLLSTPVKVQNGTPEVGKHVFSSPTPAVPGANNGPITSVTPAPPLRPALPAVPCAARATAPLTPVAAPTPTLLERNQNIYNRTNYLQTGNKGYTAPKYEAPPSALETEEMLAVVAPAIYSYHAKLDDSLKDSDKPQQLFMAYNGIGVRRTEKFNGNTITIITKTDKAPGLRSVPEGIEVEVVNKLPMHILKELIGNFRAIFQRDATESAAQVYRRKDNEEYFVYYPVQRNSGANTNYKDDIKAAVELRQEHTLVLEAHSHAGFSAFFSGGDDANEKMPLMYCVIGDHNKSKPSFAGRIRLLDKQKLLKVDEIFDIPEGVDALTFEDLPEPSPEMLANAGKGYGTHIKTQQEIAEENIKKGIHVHQGYTGGLQRQSVERDYSAAYRGYWENDERWGVWGLGSDEEWAASRVPANQSNKHTKRMNKRQARLDKMERNRKGGQPLKFDAKWISSNIDSFEAIELLELLTKRIEEEYHVNK